MLTTFKATAVKLAEGMQVEAAARGFKIILDEPKDLGGTDVGMNPVEAVLCALGACQAIVAAAFAQGRSFAYESVSVELAGDLDPDGFLGKADVRNGFQEIRYTIRFKTGESLEKAEEFAAFIEERCPVADCLANGVKLVRDRVIVD